MLVKGILFREKEINQNTFLNEAYHADLIATLFYRHISPYFGLSIGNGHFSINEFDKNIFFLGSIAGIKFLVYTWFHSYLEIYSNKYFSSFDKNMAKKKISS